VKVCLDNLKREIRGYIAAVVAPMMQNELLSNVVLGVLLKDDHPQKEII
jgi:hypothetical protein